MLLLHLEVSPAPRWPGGQVADVMAVFVAVGAFASELVRPLELALGLELELELGLELELVLTVEEAVVGVAQEHL